MEQLDIASVREALAADMTIDIVTTRARSGRRRETELEARAKVVVDEAQRTRVFTDPRSIVLQTYG